MQQSGKLSVYRRPLGSAADFVTHSNSSLVIIWREWRFLVPFDLISRLASDCQKKSSESECRKSCGVLCRERRTGNQEKLGVFHMKHKFCALLVSQRLLQSLVHCRGDTTRLTARSQISATSSPSSIFARWRESSRDLSDFSRQQHGRLSGIHALHDTGECYSWQFEFSPDSYWLWFRTTTSAYRCWTSWVSSMEYRRTCPTRPCPRSWKSFATICVGRSRRSSRSWKGQRIFAKWPPTRRVCPTSTS